MRPSRSRARPRETKRGRRSPHLHRPAFLSPSALTAPQQPSSSPLPPLPSLSFPLSRSQQHRPASLSLSPSLPTLSLSLSPQLPHPALPARSLSRRTLRPLCCWCVRFRGSCARREERSAARAPLSRQTAPAEHASSPVAKKKWDSCPEDLRSPWTMVALAVRAGCSRWQAHPQV